MTRRFPAKARADSILYSKQWDFPLLAARDDLRAAGAEPDAALLAAMATYIELLLRWNRKINLTAITDVEEIVYRNFVESFSGAWCLEGPTGRYCDVGSGAGFPGLALKLVRPGWHVTLLEPTGKKVAFLAEVARALKLTGVEIQTKRWQESSIPPTTLDAVTARALGDYEELAEWAHSRLKSRGRLILWVGAEYAESTLRALPGWDWQMQSSPGSRARVLLIGRRL
jgi:16S rRNA (guanine527-N7)-methyltransferase